MTTLDYSAFRQPLTETDLTTYDNWLQADKPSVSIIRVSIIVIVILIGFIAFLALTLDPMYATFAAWLLGLSTLFFAVPVAISLAVLAYLRRRTRHREARLYKFAVANNITISDQLGDPGFAGMIFEQGHSRILSKVLDFPDGTLISNFYYLTDNGGKDSHIHEWRFARIKLTRQLPHMVLDSRANNLFGMVSNLPSSLRGQSLSLEGDFDKHFTLYTPKQYERDALYVFTPDVMAAMIDAGRDYDMEIIDDHLILYARGRFTFDTEDQLSSILGIVQSIRSELHDQTKRYADERVGNRTINIVAKSGRRLESRTGTRSAIATAFTVTYLSLLLAGIIYMTYITTVGQ